MAKVGLKDTLALLAKGYSKKEIDALAAVDEENENTDPEVPAPVITDSTPAPQPDKDPEQPEPSDPAEPDYKQLYEEQLKKNKEQDEQIKKIQKKNINTNSLPDLEIERQKAHDSLIDSLRSFY